MKNADKIQRLRQVGLITKGSVYCLLGGLAAMVALGAGGNIEGKKGVVRFLLELPLGKVLVAAVAIGLVAYSLWRLVEAFKDPANNGNGNRLRQVLRSFYSAVFYGFIAYSFARPLLRGGSSGGDKQKAMLAEMLEKGWGVWVIGGIALLVAGQALFQIHKAYTGKYMRNLDDHPKHQQTYELIKKVGLWGYSARGVVFGIISYFLIKVIADHNANAYNGTKGVFQYLLSFEYGKFLMGIVALGLLCYGVFTILIGRYSDLTRIS